MTIINLNLEFIKHYSDTNDIENCVEELYSKPSSSFEIEDTEDLINIEAQVGELIATQKKNIELLKLEIDNIDSNLKLKLSNEKQNKVFAN